MEMEEPIDIEEWRVERTRRELARVWVVLGEGVAASSWLAKLRRLLPELEGRRPVELLDEVRGSGRLDFGVVEGREAHAMGAKLRRAGYELVVENASRVDYFAIRSVDGELSGRMDDDEERNERFCLDLIARGARVEEVEG